MSATAENKPTAFISDEVLKSLPAADQLRIKGILDLHTEGAEDTTRTAIRTVLASPTQGSTLENVVAQELRDTAEHRYKKWLPDQKRYRQIYKDYEPSAKHCQAAADLYKGLSQTGKLTPYQALFGHAFMEDRSLEEVGKELTRIALFLMFLPEDEILLTHNFNIVSRLGPGHEDDGEFLRYCPVPLHSPGTYRYNTEALEYARGQYLERGSMVGAGPTNRKPFSQPKTLKDMEGAGYAPIVDAAGTQAFAMDTTGLEGHITQTTTALFDELLKRGHQIHKPNGAPYQPSTQRAGRGRGGSRGGRGGRGRGYYAGGGEEWQEEELPKN